METLLAEDLVLMTSHPRTATLRRPSGPALPRALAAAAIDDLLAAGEASLIGDRLVLAAAPARPHPLSDHLRARLAGREHDIDGAIERLAAPRTRLGEHLLQSLADGGLVVRRRGRLLGVVPVTVSEVGNPDRVADLRARVRAALRGPVDDPRATALARLVFAGDLFRRVHVDGSGGRAALLGSTPDQDPVAAAAVRTIRRARRDAATTAAVAATAGAVAAGGS